jgi:hypothetical protein
MLLLLASNAISLPQVAPAEVHSKVTVRIERPATATKDEWERAPIASRREVIVRDDRGQPVLLRLIEYQ